MSNSDVRDADSGSSLGMGGDNPDRQWDDKSRNPFDSSDGADNSSEPSDDSANDQATPFGSGVNQGNEEAKEATADEDCTVPLGGEDDNPFAEGPGSDEPGPAVEEREDDAAIAELASDHAEDEVPLGGEFSEINVAGPPNTSEDSPNQDVESSSEVGTFTPHEDEPTLNADDDTDLQPEEPPKKRMPLSTLILLTWASLATIIAAYMWMHWPEPTSPLQNLPDDGVKTGMIVSPLEFLSSRQLFRLGETKQVGYLEVTPVSVTNKEFVEYKKGERYPRGPALVLTLRIKNVSPTSAFHPTDPVYYYPDLKRKLKGHKQFNRRGYTYTFIQPQGSFDDLIFCHDLPFELGYSIKGQDFAKLGPGEEDEYIVVAEEDMYDSLASSSVWRVKLRKGKTSSGKGVATVIGVQFDKSEVLSG